MLFVCNVYNHQSLSKINSLKDLYKSNSIKGINFCVVGTIFWKQVTSSGKLFCKFLKLKHFVVSYKTRNQPKPTETSPSHPKPANTNYKPNLTHKYLKCLIQIFHNWSFNVNDIFSIRNEKFQREKKNLWLHYIYEKTIKQNQQSSHGVPLLVKENE